MPNRYTEWLKEKMMCEICKREISRGHINNHFKSRIHKKNLAIKEDTNNKKNSDPVVIDWS
tara:strand:- start:456 stop:638 length:183 start_codon:yes stop_codon:yes gene_type:complete